MNTNIKSNKSWLIVVLAIMLVAAFSLSLAACSSQPKENNNTVTVQDDNNVNGFATEIQNTQFVKLAMSTAYAMSETGSVSKSITATVLPVTAKNKNVDWSVEWGSTNSASVTDYVTVTPDSDGSSNATVTCYKAFTGNIIVTVTTRESGYQASCVISFAGVPTDMSISGSVTPYGNGTYDMGIGQAYTFDVAMTNPFNSVGGNYNNITCSVGGVGSINVGYMEHYNSSGVEQWFETSNAILTIDSIKDSFITASYENGKLTITTVKSIESYYGTKTRMDGGRTWAYDNKFRSYVDDCYFTVTLTESTSGVSKTMTIRFDDTVVTGVNASISEMQF